jgi:hypothetical protein
VARFKWDGEIYPEFDKPNLGEMTYAERKLGLDVDDWTSTMKLMAAIFWSIRRRKPDAITWEQIEALGADELDDIILDDEPTKAPREAPAADPLAGGSPAKRGSSGGRSGPRAAAARTKRGAPSTSST